MQPKYDDKETLILEKLWSIIDTKKSHSKIEAIKNLQLKFFLDAIKNVYSNKNREKTYGNYVSQSLKCFELTKLQIFKNENSDEINFREGVIVISNHLGSNKITKISKQELLDGLTENDLNGVWLKKINGFVNDDPFLILFAGLIKTISSFISMDKVKLSAALINSPFPINKVALDCNHFLIDRESHNQYSIFEKQIIKKIVQAKKENKIPIIMIFPEGGTSGKSDYNDPFSLNNFHSGYLKVAIKQNLPILPIVQLFNSEFDFFTAVLKIETISKVDSSINSIIRDKMQKELNCQINENSFSFRARQNG